MPEILLDAIMDARTRGFEDARPGMDDLEAFTEITRNLPPSWRKAWDLQKMNEIWDAYNEGWHSALDL